MDRIIPANNSGSAEDSDILDLIWLGSGKLTTTSSSWQCAASAAPIHDATTIKARLLLSVRAFCWSGGCDNDVEELEAAEGVSRQKAAADCCWLTCGGLTAFGVEAPLSTIVEDRRETDPGGEEAAAAVRPLLHSTTTDDDMRAMCLMSQSSSQSAPPRLLRVQTAAVGAAVAMKSIRVAAAGPGPAPAAPAAPAASARWMDGVEVQQWRAAPADADDVIDAVTQCRTEQYGMCMSNVGNSHMLSSAAGASEPWLDTSSSSTSKWRAIAVMTPPAAAGELYVGTAPTNCNSCSFYEALYLL